MIDLNDVLLAMSNIPVDDPIAEIWGRGLQGGYKIIEYTGALPIAISANGDALLDYRIYGADGGVGEPTESGEPAGYKLPMTVYKQEFTVTNDMLDQSNWALSPAQLPNPSYFIYFDITDLISKEECVAKIYKNFSAGYTPGMLVVALTDAMSTLVGTTYRILNNNGTISNKEFDFSSWDKIYLCIGYGNGFRSEATKQSKIDEVFGNWKILIAPVSQTREVPVYIGENQLDAGEYVSYSDGKIYRMVGGTLTPTDPPVPLSDIPTIKGETVIDYDGEPKPSQMYVKYKGKG